MTERIKNIKIKLNKFKANEKHYSFLWVIVAILIGIFLAPNLQLNLSEIMVLKIEKLALFFMTTTGLLYFLKGTNTDIVKEIFDQENTAAAILVVGLVIAVATVIAK